MSIRKAETLSVDVDMVPLIDIISLLLMFLVMVGDMSKSTTSVKMALPRADQARSDPEDTRHRLVVQLEKDEKGQYWANIEKRRYTLEQNGGNCSLIKYLNDYVTRRIAEASSSHLNAPEPANFSVKLRIPKDAPMKEAERMIQTMARANLSNIQYAAEK